MKIIINGLNGYMGGEVARLCCEGYHGAKLVMGIDPADSGEWDVPVYESADAAESVEADCIIDFSHHSAAPAILDYAKREGLPIIVATTGHTEGELEAIYSAAESIPVFFSANMSLGVALLVELAKRTAAAMPDADIEIVEKHHTRKLDAPSGTALMLAREICSVRPEAYINPGRSGRGRRDENEIGIHAIRIGNVVGEHEVIVSTPSQTITLKHEAHSRALFAEGAIAAAEYLVGMPAGLYDMKSLVGERATVTSDEIG